MERRWNVTAKTVAFGDVEVDLAGHEIRRDGRPVSVEPQVFDVLAYLVEHRDRLVLKTELLDEVWGDRFVSESALTSRIKAAAPGRRGQRSGPADHPHRARSGVPVRGRPGRGRRPPGLRRVAGASCTASSRTCGRAGGERSLVAAPPGRARRELLDELYEDAGAAGILAVRGRMVQLTAFAAVIDALDEIGATASGAPRTGARGLSGRADLGARRGRRRRPSGACSWPPGSWCRPPRPTVASSWSSTTSNWPTGPRSPWSSSGPG